MEEYASEAEKKKAQRARYYAEHREEILAKQKAYYDKTYKDRRDAKNARSKERRKRTSWYERNKEEIKARNRAYYQEHREEIRAKGREKHAELRMEVLQHYGAQCACCGETEIKFLAIDHINGGGALHRREIGGSGKSIYYWLRDNDYPAGFQVLCHNCNVAKGFYGICPHERKRL